MTTSSMPGRNLASEDLAKAASVSGHYVPYVKRELRRRRLYALAYVGLALLAAVTAVVVVIALQR